MLRHTEASAVVEYAYNDKAILEQRNMLTEELYGNIFQVYKVIIATLFFPQKQFELFFVWSDIWNDFWVLREKDGQASQEKQISSKKSLYTLCYTMFVWGIYTISFSHEP